MLVTTPSPFLWIVCDRVQGKFKYLIFVFESGTNDGHLKPSPATNGRLGNSAFMVQVI